MFLARFKYESSQWSLNLSGLQSQNLLVGRNAVGKSKAIKAVAEVAEIILQTAKPELRSLSVDLVLQEGADVLSYSFALVEGIVSKEEFRTKENGESIHIITRSGNTARISEETVNAPSDKLVIHVRRDTVKYPIIEKLISWAQGVLAFSFNEVDFGTDNATYAWIKGAQLPLYGIIDTIASADNMWEEKIIKRMCQVGYPIKSLKRIAPEEFPELKVVLVQEEQVGQALYSQTISKGMYRTLYTVSLLEYMVCSNKPQMLLIDDLCEGLDYDRSVSVGKMVFDFCQDAGIQLIASSNDSFLMDVIELDKWHILSREGSNVAVINKSSNPELFDDFEFTGLNNFHLLSSDFIKRHKNNNE